MEHPGQLVSRVIAFQTRAVIVLFIVVVSTARASTLLSQTVRNCPCDFVIRTHIPEGPFDFIATPAKFERAQFASALRLLSQFNQTSRNAYQTVGTYAYHNVRIPLQTHVQLSVHGRQSGRGFMRQVSRTYILAEERQSSCSVLIDEDPPGSVSATSARIVGGRLANKQLAKSLVFLATPSSVNGQDGISACSGTLINKRTIVTAAHCGCNENTLAFIGETKIDGSSNPYEVESAFSHPRYKGEDADIVQFDIAVVYLKKNVTKGVTYMKYNKDENLPVPDKPVRSIGYGLTDEGLSETGAGTLRQVDLIAQSDDECEARHVRVRVDLNSDRILCAGRTDRDGCGICSGDSGGPLVYYGNGTEPILVGVVSSSVECGDKKFPGLYVRTSAHVDFIEGNYVSSQIDWKLILLITGAVAIAIVFIATIASFLCRRRN